MSAPSVSSTEKAKVAAAEAKVAAAAARQAAKEAAAAAKEERRKEREAAKAAKAAAKAALPKRPRGRPRKNPAPVAEALPPSASESGDTTDMDNMSAASSTHFDADSDSEIAVLRAELSALKARHAALEIAYHKAAHTLDSIRATLAIAAL
jgi:hypothetical protein